MMENPVQVSTPSRWIRLLYMILFAVLYKVAEFVMWVAVVFQVVVTVLTGTPNARVQRFGRQLSAYVYSLWLYLTWNTEQQPFPFSEWPPIPPARDPAD
jgi:hypothetical protein